jgi:hypothetical protein
MNFKKQAEKLEKFLEDEFKSKVPIVVLKDGTLVYKTFKIKKVDSGNWVLRNFIGDDIDIFKLKVSAVLAAKFYSNNNLTIYNQIKVLDTDYWTNSYDSMVFRERYEKSNDIFKKEVYNSRWGITKHRADNYKQQIIGMFTRNFG